MIGLMICVGLSMTKKENDTGIDAIMASNINKENIVKETPKKTEVKEIAVKTANDTREKEINKRLMNLNDIIGDKDTGKEERESAINESIKIIETLPEDEQIGKLIALAISKQGY